LLPRLAGRVVKGCERMIPPEFYTLWIEERAPLDVNLQSHHDY
ncbi:MAG: hypothetical protein RLZ24_337, partial [Actinomycetota bacterium]